MLKHLQIEWMKIKNYRVFQVFSVLYLLGILFIIYIFYKVYINLIAKMQETLTGVQGEGSDLFNLFSGESIWRTVCFSTSFLLYLPGMIIINLFINEVNFKTHRQNIIDGWKRETFIFTKINLILIMAFVITIMNLLATIIMAQITHTSLDFAAGAKILSLSFIQSFIYLMFALLLATVFRRSGIAIIVFFLYGLVFEAIFVWLLNQVVKGLGNFLPLQVGDSLVVFAGAEGWMYDGLPGLAVMVPAAIAFAGLYIFLAVRKYKNDDL